MVGGELHTCALLSSGEVWCWGENDDYGFPVKGNDRGQLGDGTTNPSTRPVQVLNVTNAVQISSSLHSTCAVTSDGNVWCWGGNHSGLLGDGTNINFRPTPVLVQGIAGVVQVSVGGHHTCARTSEGEAWCWGAEYDGRLGNGQHPGGYALTPVRVDSLEEVVDISAGHFHTCAVDASGGAWCWGNNGMYQIGYGGWEDRVLEPTRVKDLDDVARLSAGRQHTCALLKNKQVWCWGSGMFGSLGDGADFPQDSMVPVRAKGLEDVIDISMGGDGSCAVTEDGKLWCWGTHVEGEGGPGGPGGPMLMKLPGPGMGGASEPVEVPDVTDAATVGAGIQHACYVTVKGEVRCWGDNESGQIGDGSTTRRSDPVPVAW